jgi:hypothetical protein
MVPGPDRQRTNAVANFPSLPNRKTCIWIYSSASRHRAFACIKYHKFQRDRAGDSYVYEISVAEKGIEVGKNITPFPGGIRIQQDNQVMLPDIKTLIK